MLYKGYVIGASFSRGDSLHFEQRYLNNTELYTPITEKEKYNNFVNSYSYTLFNKLNLGTPRLFQNGPTFLDNIKDLYYFVLSEFINNKEYLKTKLILIQLSNPQREFTFENKGYNLDFESEEGLIKSMDKIFEIQKSDDFKKRFYDSVMLFFKDMDAWETNNIKTHTDLFTKMLNKLEKYGVILKVYSYFSKIGRAHV